jgi:penicillin-binding protein 1A
MAGAYSVFANGGFRVNPYLIQKITDIRGNVLFEATPVVPSQEANRVLDARNAFITDSLLREVTTSGTGASASQKLARHDLAGKTGTTSDAFDGWFAGYSGNTTAVAWMGFDEPRSLGTHEFGATAALPIWIDYMRVNLAKQPNSVPSAPPGVSMVRGDWAMDGLEDSTATRSIDLDPLQKLIDLFSF